MWSEAFLVDAPLNDQGDSEKVMIAIRYIKLHNCKSEHFSGGRGPYGHARNVWQWHHAESVRHHLRPQHNGQLRANLQHLGKHPGKWSAEFAGILYLCNNVFKYIFIIFKLFTEYGVLALDKNDEAPFQKLQFLVRDWMAPTEHPYGAIGGCALLNKRLKIDAKVPNTFFLSRNW